MLRLPAHREARMLDGAGEAQPVALACSEPLLVLKRLSLLLSKQRLIELRVVDAVSAGCGTPHAQKRCQAVADASLVLPVLGRCRVRLSHGALPGLYQQPHDMVRTPVCLDENSKQVQGEARKPPPLQPRAVAARSALMSDMHCPSCSCCTHRWRADAMSTSQRGALQ